MAEAALAEVRDSYQKGSDVDGGASESILPPISKAPKSGRNQSGRITSGRNNKLRAIAPPSNNDKTLSLPPLSERQLGKSETQKKSQSFDHTRRMPMPTHTSSFWKGNVDIHTWFKEKEKRDREVKARKTRQAMKDAQWVLDRREAQMKAIQKRLKLERAESQLQQSELDRARKARRSILTEQAQSRRASRGGRGQPLMRTSIPSAASSEQDHLRWQDVSMVRTKKVPKDPVNAVW
eukprot:CAMPEP_0118926170 /NCGR_PEP_ID=MMETSP1169-20130426/3931_1 /TAXON_ID=36882 /ORGANISM="Pyramimonas obovata, Strain CCMP722" /LENGTH=235 /DNA_ID=CAMNT_0006867671 /DNA_START=117 /DNA_END=821 /DNA_ORIENTATION=+